MSARSYTKRHRSGSTTTWVKLLPGETAVIIRDDAHYRLGGQVDEVMAGHVLTESERVVWDSIEQKWLPTGHQIVITPKAAT